MAGNTEILIKRSLGTNVPVSLQQGELAYSYSSNTLFIGTPDGAGSIEIGHRSDLSNLTANTYGDATHIPIITVDSHGTVTNVTTSAISTTLNLSSDDGSNTMSLLDGTLTISGGEGITTSIDGNSVVLIDVDNTVVRANTAGANQTIDGDVNISGNLVVLGTQTIVDSQTVTIADPLMLLANNNTEDVLDIGTIGQYSPDSGATILRTGIYRHAGDKKYYIFDGYSGDITANTVNPADGSFNLSELNANLQAPYANVTNKLYVSGQAQFDDTTVNFTAGTNAWFQDGSRITLGPNSHQRYVNQDDGNFIDLRNSGTVGNTDFRIYDNNLDTDILAVQTNSVTNASTLTLFNSMDIRDDESGESVLSKGEQKFGVITRVNMDGIGGATFKTITDTSVPPMVGDMNAVDLGTNQDDAFTEVTFPVGFSFSFNGTTYNSVFVGSNGYVTFGAGSSNNSHSYPPNASNPGQPAIVVANGDISYQRVYTYEEGPTFRIRWEGSSYFSGQHIGGSSEIVWEILFYKSTGAESQFDVRVVKLNGQHGGQYWTSYLTDGSDFIGNRDYTRPFPVSSQIASQLVYNEKELTLNDDGLFSDGVRADSTPTDVIFYNQTTKELTYGSLQDLNPDSLANGSTTFAVSSDGYAYSSGKILAAQSVGTVDGGFSFTGNEGGYDTGMFSPTDGQLGFYTNNVEYFRVDINTGYNYTYVPLVLANGAVLKDESNDAVAFGEGAGTTNQGLKSVAIGFGAGNTNQDFLSVAIGDNAGNLNQGHSSVALGHTAGRNYQGTDAVAIGVAAGQASQGNYAVAIGERAGYGDNTSQGVYAIAIGAHAGYSDQYQNSIILNASGNDLNSYTEGLFINPVRYTETQDATYDGLMFYNADTKEVRYSYTLDGGSF